MPDPPQLPADLNRPGTVTVPVPFRDAASTNVAPEAKWLLNRRDGYEADCRWWKFLRDMRAGGRAFKDGRHLPVHILETEGATSATSLLKPGVSGGGGATGYKTRNTYELRLEQSGRFNLVDDVLDAYQGYIEGNPPARALPESVIGLQEFTDRADVGRKRSLTQVMNEETGDGLGLGIAWIGVDHQISTDDVRAMAGPDAPPEGPDGPRVDATALFRRFGDDALPHVYTIAPEDMLQATFDAGGNLIEALVQEQLHNGAALDSGGAGFETVYRHWTLATWKLYALRKGEGGKVRAVLLADGENKYGQVVGALPIFRLAVKLLTPFRGRSAVEDVALVDRMLADDLSSLSFNLANGSDKKVDITAPLSAFEGKNPQQKDAYVSDLVAGQEAPVGVYSEGVKIESSERTFAGAALMLEMFTQLYRLQLQTKGLGDKVSDVTTPESGVAKFRAFRMLNAALVRVGEAMAKVEYQVLRAAAFYLGGEKAMKAIESDVVVYPKDYDVETVDALVALRESLEGKAPAEVLNWITDQILRKAFPSRAPDLVEAHEAALKGFSPSPPPQAQSPAPFPRSAPPMPGEPAAPPPAESAA